MIFNKVKEWIQALQSTRTGNGPSNSREEILPLLSSLLNPAAAPSHTTHAAAAPSVTIPMHEPAAAPALVPTSVPVQASKPIVATAVRALGAATPVVAPAAAPAAVPVKSQPTATAPAPAK
jgi:hypothetical protein